MTTPFLSFEQLTKLYHVEQDWLFEKLLGKLNSLHNLILTAEQKWGIQEYVGELGFQLAEKNPEIHVCTMDMKLVYSQSAFLEHFRATLSHKFPEVTSPINIDSSRLDILQLPAFIACRKKIKVAVFLANSHLFHRLKDPAPFLRTLKLNLKNQKDCVFCLFGNSNPNIGDLIKYPGPLSGLGQVFELRHNPTKHRSASIRKLFHDHNKSIGYSNSIHMSHLVDNNPFYLKLLAWNALIRTHQTCTMAIIDKAMSDLVLQFDYVFHRISERLTQKQIDFLRALVGGNQKLFSNTVREEYQLGRTSHVTRIKSCLERKEIIQTGIMGIEFTDPLFRVWFRKFYPSNPWPTGATAI